MYLSFLLKYFGIYKLYALMGNDAYVIHANILQLSNKGDLYIYFIKNSLVTCGSIL